VQRVADILVAEGLAARSPNPANRRSPLFSLTATGRAVLISINSASQSWLDLVEGELGAAEIESLTASLQRFVGPRAPGLPAEASPRVRDA
jgi:DNA-binding MarR family transcriptional regulator